MKTRILLAALVLTIATAGFAINPQPEPPGFAAAKMPVLRHQFVISPISALKLSIGNRPPTKVMSAKVQTPIANRLPGLMQAPTMTTLVGNPYATGSGVVLDVLNSIDKATNSKLTVYDVLWNDNLINALAAKDPQAKLAVRTTGQDSDAFFSAYFGNIAPGLHTYLLTLGTTANTDILNLAVAGQPAERAQLVVNPATNEVRFCFTYNNTGAFDNYLYVSAWFNHSTTGSSIYEYFHHLQLVQLD